MRILFAVPLLALALPAQARDRTPPPADPTTRALGALTDPRVQDGVATMINRFSDVLLDTRVGPMAALTNPRDDVRPNDTMRDLAQRNDPAFEAKMRDNTRNTVRTAGRAVGAAGAFTAEMNRTADRLRAVLDGAPDPDPR